MYRTCLTCTSDLLANDVIEHQSVGRKLAFDAQQGRLWVICASCSKWNLVPFEHRLEAIDECERLFRDTPTRYATDNIGMAHAAGGLTLIRVGKPIGEEFASWRYGEAFRARRKRTRLVSGAIVLPIVAAYMGIMGRNPTLGSIPGIIATADGLAYGAGAGLFLGRQQADRWLMRIKVKHPATGKRIRLESMDIRHAMLLVRGDRRGLSLLHGKRRAREELFFDGEAGEVLAGRALARLNANSGAPDELNEALAKAAFLNREAQGESLYRVADRLLDRSPSLRFSLAHQDPAVRLALEMHGNEETERRILTGELQFLERQWREAEELAKIADTLALPGESGAA